MYRIEKLERDKPSKVYEGYVLTGNNLLTRIITEDENGITSISIQPITLEGIKCGMEVIVSSGVTEYIKTSPVQDILLQTDTEVIFKTQTSTYKLQEINDDD